MMAKSAISLVLASISCAAAPFALELLNGVRNIFEEIRNEEKVVDKPGENINGRSNQHDHGTNFERLSKADHPSLNLFL